MPWEFTTDQLDDHYRRFYQNAWSDDDDNDSSPSDRSPPVQDVVSLNPILSPPDSCPVASSRVVSVIPSSCGKLGTTASTVSSSGGSKLGAVSGEIPSSCVLGIESAVSGGIPSRGKLGAESAVSGILSSGKFGAESAVSGRILSSGSKLGAESAVSGGIPGSSGSKLGVESAVSGGIPSSSKLGAESAVSGILSSGKFGAESAVSGGILSSGSKLGAESAVSGGIPCSSGKLGAESDVSKLLPVLGIESSPVTGIPAPIPSSRCEKEIKDHDFLGHKDSRCYKNELRLHQMTEREKTTHERLKNNPSFRDWYMNPICFIKSVTELASPSEVAGARPLPRRKPNIRIGLNDLRSNTYRERYDREVKKSDGFYVNDRPGRRVYGEIYPVNLRDEDNIVKCEKLAITAIRAYNKKNTRDLQLVKLVMATCQNVCGPLYYLTFIAKHPHAMNPAEKCGKTYQAKVFRGCEVVAFRVHPEKGQPDPKEKLWLDDDSDDSEEEKVVKKKRQTRKSNKTKS